MENNSEPGKINISENTYELIKEAFNCEYRVKLKKNRGMMKMYFNNFTCENKMLDHKNLRTTQHETIVLIIKVNEDMNNLKKVYQ
jgi:hypothetical protein